MCDFEWTGPWWGADPEYIADHWCAEDESHAGPHRCRCGETRKRESHDSGSAS